MRLVGEDMNAVNQIILDKAISDVDMIPELAHHLIEFRGQAAATNAHHSVRKIVWL